MESGWCGFWKGGSVSFFLLLFYVKGGKKKYLTCHFCLHLICSLKFPLRSSFYFHHDQSDIKHPLCCRSLKSKLHHVSFSCLFSPPCHSEVSIHWLSAHVCGPSLFLNASLLVRLFSFLFSLTKTPSCHVSAPNCHHLIVVTHTSTPFPCPHARLPSLGLV